MSIRSPISDNNVGSTCTAWHTSDKSFAVKSLTLLWQMLINPPFLHDILCWIVNIDPQAYVVGKFAICQSYVILHCHKTVVLWDQIRFQPLEAPITNLIIPFLSLLHSVLFYLNDFSNFCKMFLYRSCFSAFILLFSFETSNELTPCIGYWLMLC